MEYQSILFAPDGEYQKDNKRNTIEVVWEAVNDMGSRWIFYPIAVVANDTHVVEGFSDGMLDTTVLEGMTIKQASGYVKKHCDVVDVQHTTQELAM